VSTWPPAWASPSPIVSSSSGSPWTGERAMRRPSMKATAALPAVRWRPSSEVAGTDNSGPGDGARPLAEAGPRGSRSPVSSARWRSAKRVLTGPSS
jgi:hypothetical protein